jgi:non-homologous end joining protein Ku
MEHSRFNARFASLGIKCIHHTHPTLIEKPVEKVEETKDLVATLKASLQKTKTKKKG